MDDLVLSHTLDSVPQLYALHREENEEGPAAVVAWGLAFADGRALTLWTDPYPGAATVSSSLRAVEEFTPPTSTPTWSG